MVYFNHVTRLYDFIYIKLPCEPTRKAACPEDWITQQITEYANVQTQTQSTVLDLLAARVGAQALRGFAMVLVARVGAQAGFISGLGLGFVLAFRVEEQNIGSPRYRNPVGAVYSN